MTLTEKQQKVQEYRPIDDVFFEALAQNKDVCQEILSTILEDSNLIVEDVIVQSSERNLYGRSVRLDALCTLGNGEKVNIEVQRSDNDDHLKRARYNAAVITSKETDPGNSFENIRDLYIVYISEFDFLKGGKTIYHVDKVLRETGNIVDDGLHEIFVNTVIDDGTEIAELMSCFLKKDVNNPKFPYLTNEVKRLKSTERGVLSMCTIMDNYIKEAVEQNSKETAQAMLQDNFEVDVIAKYTKLSIQQIEELQKKITK